MTIALTLPLVLFVVLFELAVGGTTLMWLLDREPDIPRGFLRLAGVVSVAAASLGALIGPYLPSAVPDLVAKFGILVALLTAAYFLTTLLPSVDARRAVGTVAVFAGLLLLVMASISHPGSPYDVLALVALPLGALTLGGVDAAMLLGHWYLVTPKLSPKPLQRAALVFVVALALQATSAILVVARGDIATAWELSAVAVLIRLGIGIVAPLPIALGAWWTARMNTQSSTGLLFVGLGMVLAGEISARMLFYVTGVPL